MILVAIGANLPHPHFGSPRASCEAAVLALDDSGQRIKAQSRWYESAPNPASNQPWFVNGVVALDSVLEPDDLMAHLHALEAQFDRQRSIANAARTLDLDLLAYGEMVSAPGAPVILPHPRLSGRAFVLWPLRDIAPEWRHPVSGTPLADLIANLEGPPLGAPDATIRVLN